MKRITLAALAAALMSSGAYAADVFGRDSLKDSGSTVVSSSPWQGPYVALGGGFRWHNWDSLATAALCNGAPNLPGDGWDGSASDCNGQSSGPDVFTPADVAHDENSDGWVVTGRVGYDWRAQGYSRVVFGVFGEANWVEADTDHFADAEFVYGGGARLGYLLTDRLLAYINAGVELTEYSGLDTKVDPFLGGGLELLLADGWSVAGEGRWTFADDGDLPAGTTNNDPVTARLLLIKKF
mgnify:CR=1 FL=1